MPVILSSDFMKHIIYSFFLSVTLFSISPLHAQQQREHYELLWEISGNGLTKPSYLFGTMHLTDKRVFDFSDSVIAKIKECQGFALEFSPDSVSELMSQILLHRSTNDTIERDFKKDLTESEYAILKEKLRSETSMNLDHVKGKTPQQIANLINSPSLYHNDKENFLDAYLYRIALGEKKIMRGLEQTYEEDTDTYQEGLNNLKEIIYEEEYKHSLEQLIEIYYEGDIEKIQQIVVQEKDTASLNRLYKRNHIMANRIQEFSPQQTMFYAVGAAHLPGEEGIIALLRKKGYTVSKVPSTFTGYATHYKPKAVEFNWQQYTYEENGYSISLPGKPFEYNDDKGTALKFHIYPNLATGAFYLVMSIPLPLSVKEDELDKMSDTFIRAMFKGKKSKGTKKKMISHKGAKGVEADFFDAKSNMHGKVRILQKFGLIYFQMIFCYKKESLKSPESKTFFESLEFIKPKEIKRIKPEESQKDSLVSPIQYLSKTGAYSVYSSCHLKDFKGATEPQPGQSKDFFATGNENWNLSYWVGYHLLSQGTSVIEDSLYLANFAESMTEETPDSIAKVKDIIYKGYPGKEFFRTESNGQIDRIKVVLRGSRLYMLFATGSQREIEKPKVEQFMQSLEFLPFEKTNWKDAESQDHKIQWKTKGDAILDVDTIGNVDMLYDSSYNSIDTCSGISYVVNVNSYSPYYFTPQETFFKDQRAIYVGETDSVIYEKKPTIQGIQGVEWIVKSRESQNLKRIMIVPLENKIIYLFSYFVPDLVQSEYADPFFSSLKFTESKPKVTLFESKAKQLLSDLSSVDSTVQRNALDMLAYYKFEPKDKESVYKELHKNFADDSADYENTKSILLSRLVDLEDNSTVPFIKDLYPKLTDYPWIQIQALKALLNLKSKASKDAFVELINQDIPSVSFIPLDFFAALKDSTALNVSLYPEIFPLMKSSHFRNDMYGLSFILIDSNLIKREFFLSHIEQLIAFSKEDLEEADNYNTPYLAAWNSITFFGRFTEQKEVVDFLVFMSHHSDDVLAFEAVTELIKHNISVDPLVLDRFAGLNKYRLSLYYLLRDSDQLALFPIKFYKQEFFAAANMYEYLVDIENEFNFEKIELINSKVVNYRGVSSRFYLFKLLSEGEWYVGISGPYSLDKKLVYSDDTSATDSFYNLLKSKSINAHYDDFLKGRDLYYEEMK